MHSRLRHFRAAFLLLASASVVLDSQLLVSYQ